VTLKTKGPVRRYSVVVPEAVYEKLRKCAFKKRETVAEITRQSIEAGIEMIA
jgi:hypothetical protein